MAGRQGAFAWVRRFVIIVALTFGALTQFTFGDTPAPRRFAGMVYDAARQEIVLFGGGNDTEALNDTWVWDGRSWTQKFPPVSPSARSAWGVMGYDPVGQLVVLFSGDSLSDTWTWDGTTWTQVFPPASPPGRGGSGGMAYYPDTSELLLFGGYPGYQGTWAWDGTTWTEKVNSSEPSGRWGLGMAYDAASNGIVLFGGYGGDYFNDTWVWDGINWNLKRPPTAPHGREGPGMAYDAAHKEIVVFGGCYDYCPNVNDTWTLDGTTWTEQHPVSSPSPRNYPSMAYDEARKQIVLFGGAGDVYLNDTWIWDGNNWSSSDVKLSHSTLDFGLQLLNVASAAQSVTLTNQGSLDLAITNIQANGDYSQRNDCESALAPGARCNINVTFTPTAKGTRTGSITITDNAADNPQTISLTGMGTVVQLSTRAANFGDQAVGTTSKPRTVKITNVGTDPLHFSGIAITGKNVLDFGYTTTCGANLGVGVSCTISVIFTPKLKGGRQATLSISDNGGGSPQNVNLRGNGI